MEWVKLYTRMPRDPAIRAAQARCPHAIALFTLGLCYIGEQETDGFIPAFEPPTWQIPRHKQAAAALVAEGLWIVVDGGWSARSWLTLNQSKEKAEAARAAAAERQRRHRHGVTSTMTHATRVEESRSSSPNPAGAGRSCPAHETPHPSCRGCGTNPRALRAEARKARWGPWCGACDERTRMFDDDQGRAVKCSCRGLVAS